MSGNYEWEWGSYSACVAAARGASQQSSASSRRSVKFWRFFSHLFVLPIVFGNVGASRWERRGPWRMNFAYFLDYLAESLYQIIFAEHLSWPSGKKLLAAWKERRDSLAVVVVVRALAHGLLWQRRGGGEGWQRLEFDRQALTSVYFSL